MYAIAIAEGGRSGEVRYLGEFDASATSMRKVVVRLAAKHGKLHFCYEAGPTGYGLHRLITEMGHACSVVAPSLIIPRKPGDRVKTNRRDALGLAKLLRAGELTEVWVPDEEHEAMRDLVRARAAAVEALRVHRQQESSFLLKHGRHFPRKTTWGAVYLRWQQEQKFAHPAHQIALQEGVDAVRVAKERLGRLDRAIEEFLPRWSLAPVVQALQALHGIDSVVVITFVTEIGELRRFDKALRWAILQRADGKMTEAQAEALAELETSDLFTSIAWRIKEKLRWVRKADTIQAARWRITNFLRHAHEMIGDNSILNPIRKALATVENHRQRILERWTSAHSNARLEVLNGLFQAARARARGYRNSTTFATMIYPIVAPLRDLFKST
jgi:transposase